MLIRNQPTTSSRCGTSSCVEVTRTDGVQVRDTKPGGAAVDFTVDAWRRFAAAVKNEELTEKEDA